MECAEPVSPDGTGIISGKVSDVTETHLNVMKNECRVWLFKTLLSHNLCTRDIYAFVLNQARLRVEDQHLDEKTMRSAMNTKLRDLKKSVCNAHRRRRKAEAVLLTALGGKAFKLLKHLKKIRQTVKKEREKLMDTYRQKIQHYKKTQRRGGDTIQEATEVGNSPPNNVVRPTIPPRYLGEFASLSVFGTAGDLPKPNKPLGPFICCRSIKLNRGEHDLLSKDPKFSLKQEPTELSFSTEIERMNSKHRYGASSKKTEMNIQTMGMTSIKDQDKPYHDDRTDTLKKAHDGRTDTLQKIFEENEQRFTFNPIEKTVKFTHKRPTDYKLNRHVKLPRPLSTDQEFECETRRRSYIKAFRKYECLSTNKKESMGTGNSEPKTVDEHSYKNKKGCLNKYINLTKNESVALESLKARVKNKELIITQTDKSSRFSVLTSDQYIKAGQVHTSKDTKTNWREVKYLQGQVNSHVWWLNKVLRIAEKTDSDRMMKNTQNSSLELPEMRLLVKDHKAWSEASGTPVPTRPVVSGNKGINTHISEILSELLEPLVMNLGSAEISSTEEALYRMHSINENIRNGVDISNMCVLKDMCSRYHSQPTLEEEFERMCNLADLFEMNPYEKLNDIFGPPSILPHQTTSMLTQTGSQYSANCSDNNIDMKTSRKIIRGTSISYDDLFNTSLDADDINIVETLTGLGWAAVKERKQLNGIEADSVIPNLSSEYYLGTGGGEQPFTPRVTSDHVQEQSQSINTPDGVGGGTASPRTFSDLLQPNGKQGDLDLYSKKDIRRYFNKDSVRKKTSCTGEKDEREWWRKKDLEFRKNSEKRKTFNSSIKDLVNATFYWKKWDEDRMNKMMNQDKATSDCQAIPPLQDFTKRPVFVGADVCALYPSLDMVGTAELVAEAVRRSTVCFKSIDYEILSIYLLLTVGEQGMRETGLGRFIPTRKKEIKSTAMSLNATINRKFDNWQTKCEDMDAKDKIEMLALLVKISSLVMMKTTCYLFGGVIYKQASGVGIGLRASACIAKLIMGLMDKRWAEIQSSWGLICQILIRYIDDIRLYMFPIRDGWHWTCEGWKFSENQSCGEGDLVKRTSNELGNSLNTLVDFLKFTTESERDYENGLLPTLDTETKVMEDGTIYFRFYSKPMSNNIVIQRGTALPQNTIFSALRQEMIRRLYNSCPLIDLDSKLMIIEAYIQKLVNSGHKFPFIKAVILQGITKHKAMVDRSNLKLENKKYLPLYRPRNYKTEERLMMKYVDAMVWYTDVKLGDPYKGEWKGRLLRRKRIDGHLGRVKDQSKNNSVITTAMFVPPSREGRLLKLVEEVEKDINSDLSWRPKILEQSGTPLLLCFGAKFPLVDGCPRGQECLYCENDGIRCAKRGVVYEASCKTCKDMLKVECMDEVKR